MVADNTIHSSLGFLRLLVLIDSLSAVQERQQQSMAHFACVQKVSLPFYGNISYNGCMPFDLSAAQHILTIWHGVCSGVDACLL